MVHGAVAIERRAPDAIRGPAAAQVRRGRTGRGQVEQAQHVARGLADAPDQPAPGDGAHVAVAAAIPGAIGADGDPVALADGGADAAPAGDRLRAPVWIEEGGAGLVDGGAGAIDEATEVVDRPAVLGAQGKPWRSIRGRPVGCGHPSVVKMWPQK